ncbi:Aste57867_20723 [Aphanomyces stellatus]|uniref:Aste57867_20723 protein n=1 Tax=Aphanomyces stellatus TaxID=120398 RepID=A0A485LKC8_9STRA|nr:hypothetical protein As57867_020655 [Aphanomyces stellatus]VFT97403.1 Aste57867_20723 [Aphanomyces stellatus]
MFPPGSTTPRPACRACNALWLKNAIRASPSSPIPTACTDPMPWPMPNLDSAMACLVGTSVYFTLDWTKGYWQLPLHPESQEFFSFMTPFGVYTPTRVLMGQTDADYEANIIWKNIAFESSNISCQN